ncbi:MAG: hypothetical protein WA705_00925 [Candidatus Ozemobacteraceae bacterium]
MGLAPTGKQNPVSRYTPSQSPGFGLILDTTSEQSAIDAWLADEHPDLEELHALLARIGIPLAGEERLLLAVHRANVGRPQANRMRVLFADLRGQVSRAANARNRHMADVIGEEVLKKGRKGLFICGAGHADLVPCLETGSHTTDTTPEIAAGAILANRFPGRIFAAFLRPPGFYELDLVADVVGSATWAIDLGRLPFRCFLDSFAPSDAQRFHGRMIQETASSTGFIFPGLVRERGFCGYCERALERPELYDEKHQVQLLYLFGQYRVLRDFPRLKRLLLDLYQPSSIEVLKQCYVTFFQNMVLEPMNMQPVQSNSNAFASPLKMR